MPINKTEAEHLRVLIVKTHMTETFKDFLLANDELQRFIDDITEGE